MTANDVDWVAIQKRFEQETCSVRALARQFGTTDTRIRRHALANAWTPYVAPQRRLQREPELVRRARQGRAPYESPETVEAIDPAIPHPTEIARATCGTLNTLRVNLDLVVRELSLVRELADAETAGDDNPARARLVDKVLSLPGLIKAANDLTSAIARLADLGPGKKASALDLAKTADNGLFATPPAPDRILQ